MKPTSLQLPHLKMHWGSARTRSSDFTDDKKIPQIVSNFLGHVHYFTAFNFYRISEK
jgi:hypothetical protein